MTCYNKCKLLKATKVLDDAVGVCDECANKLLTAAVLSDLTTIH